MRLRHTEIGRAVRNHRRPRSAARAALSGLLIMTTPAFAVGPVQDPFGNVRSVSDQQLDHMRGGFSVNGFIMRFGMEVQSSVSGVGKVVTKLTWADQGRGWTTKSTWVYREPVSAAPTSSPTASPTPVAAAATSIPTVEPTVAPTQVVPTPTQVIPTPAIETATVSEALVTPVVDPTSNSITVVPTAGGDPPAMPEGVAVITPVVTPTPPVVEPSVQSATISVPVPVPTAELAPVTVITPVPPAPPAESVPQSVAGYVAQQPVTELGQNGFQVTVANTPTTEILHQVTQGHLATLINNRESGVTISQSTTLDIGIENFTQQMSTAMTAIRARSVVGSGFNRM